MRSEVAIVGVVRTPYRRMKSGDPDLTVDEYIAWAADLALKHAGMTKNDFDGQGLGVAHAEAAHTVNWSAATAENLGISPQVLLRADQGGGLAYIVTSAETARKLTDKPVYLRGFGEINNYYHGSRSLPDVTTTGFAAAAPRAMAMAGVRHADVDLFQPYDDYPFVAMMSLEDWGFCKKGEGGRFIDEHDLSFHGDFPLSTARAGSTEAGDYRAQDLDYARPDSRHDGRVGKGRRE